MPKTANTRAPIRHLAIACADLGLPYHRNPALSGIIQETNRLLVTIDDELEQSLAALIPEDHEIAPFRSQSPGFALQLRDPRTYESDWDIPAGEYAPATAKTFGFLSGYDRLRIDNGLIRDPDHLREDNVLTGGDYAWGGFHIV